MNRHYKESGWYHYLEHSMRDLVDQSVILLERERGFKKIVFHDYSYVVFPAAKAYEGFIKQFLLDSGLLIASQYESRHFRIGKSLNPDLPERYRDEEVARCGKHGGWVGIYYSIIFLIMRISLTWIKPKHYSKEYSK